MSLLNLVVQGWLAMVPLFICSILVVAVILERIWSYSRTGRTPKELMRRVEGLLAAGQTYDAVRLLDDYDSPYARVAKSSIMLTNPSAEEVTDTLVLACESELATATKPLPVLGTIGNIAPFIGLFGTVLGIIGAFQKIGVHESAGYAVVSKDIAFALIATAFGLGIGIISVVANNWCNAWVERYRLDLERFSTEWSYRLKNLRQTAETSAEPLV